MCIFYDALLSKKRGFLLPVANTGVQQVKIYDHPIEPQITVIEIEKSDEKNEFLNEIISGFDEYGMAYNSASFGDAGEKQVMYVDCRKKEIFSDYEKDVACALTVGLIDLQEKNTYDKMLDACVTIAEAAGDDELLEGLMNKPPEFFNMFKSLKKVA